jgi:FAD/FMN-containing dehydrogenase
MKRWNIPLSEERENAKVDAFLEDIAAVCRRHGMSIAHEDGHGAFIIEKYSEMTRDWLMGAHDATTGDKPNLK